MLPYKESVGELLARRGRDWVPVQVQRAFIFIDEDIAPT
jgi:hypothetical protein